MEFFGHREGRGGRIFSEDYSTLMPEDQKKNLWLKALPRPRVVSTPNLGSNLNGSGRKMADNEGCNVVMINPPE